LLIDVGPDFRQQALTYGIDRLDGLLLTHTHYDHIAGIDELRIFYFKQNRELPLLLSQESFTSLKIRYPYLFQRLGEATTVSARLELHLLPQDSGEIEFSGAHIGYCTYRQGDMSVNGYRIGDFAYISDIREYDDSVFKALRGVKNLVLSALREKPSELHLSLEEAVAFARKVEAKNTRLTHLSHYIDHETMNAKLPPDVQLAFDGMEMHFEI
jgi:phosphoribosyl 1,2-cyclic phosphate phosphodiesterase